jgi:hypothetical protein
MNTETCPRCQGEGEPTKCIAAKPVEWRCGCGFEWDINEDFNCLECGKPVPGRFLFCSAECDHLNQSRCS